MVTILVQERVVGHFRLKLTGGKVLYYRLYYAL